jgi:glucokinase
MIDAFEHDSVRHVVLADVGGTNVRFALLMGGELGPIEHLAVRDYKHFSDALDAPMSHCLRARPGAVPPWQAW